MLGPILYVVYMSPVADIIKSYGLSYRLYTDDSPLYTLPSVNFHQQLLDAKDYIETVSYTHLTLPTKLEV